MSEELPVGTRLGGYRIQETLGRGGMGVVYRAFEERIEREVALKVLAPEVAKDEEFVQRFVREARVVGALEHERIMKLLHVGHERGLTFLVFEYVRGGSLEQELARRGPLEWRRAALVAAEVA